MDTRIRAGLGNWLASLELDGFFNGCLSLSIICVGATCFVFFLMDRFFPWFL